jgi:hypothetical protein
MTYTTIADLLADPVLGKLEEVQAYQGEQLRRGYVGETPAGSILSQADAALLAVANAKGTADDGCDCPRCRMDRAYWKHHDKAKP